MRTQPTNRLAIAERLAVKEHGDHRRKTGTTTVEHLRRVSRAVEHHGEHTQIVAWLHDILEDTGVAHGVIAGLFGQSVLDDVRSLTHDTLSDTYAAYIRSLCKDGTPSALRVKLADLIDNMDGPEEDWHRVLLRRYEPAFENISLELKKREELRWL